MVRTGPCGSDGTGDGKDDGGKGNGEGDGGKGNAGKGKGKGDGGKGKAGKGNTDLALQVMEILEARGWLSCWAWRMEEVNRRFYVYSGSWRGHFLRVNIPQEWIERWASGTD